MMIPKMGSEKERMTKDRQASVVSRALLGGETPVMRTRNAPARDSSLGANEVETSRKLEKIGIALDTDTDITYQSWNKVVLLTWETASNVTLFSLRHKKSKDKPASTGCRISDWTRSKGSIFLLAAVALTVQVWRSGTYQVFD